MASVSHSHTALEHPLAFQHYNIHLPEPLLEQFLQGCWLLSLQNSIRSRDLGVGLSACYSVTACRSYQQTHLENLCVSSHMCVRIHRNIIYRPVSVRTKSNNGFMTALTLSQYYTVYCSPLSCLSIAFLPSNEKALSPFLLLVDIVSAFRTVH